MQYRKRLRKVYSMTITIQHSGVVQRERLRVEQKKEARGARASLQMLFCLVTEQPNLILNT